MQYIPLGKFTCLNCGAKVEYGDKHDCPALTDLNADGGIRYVPILSGTMLVVRETVQGRVAPAKLPSGDPRCKEG